jgi:excisionase family DNA binding protein
MTDYITTTEAAIRLGVSRPLITQMAREGRIAATRIGRDWLIDADGLNSVQRPPIGRPRNPDAKPASVKRRGTAR